MDWRKFKFTDEHYLILRTIKTYEKTESGKSWRKNPVEIEQGVVSPEHFTNYVTAIPFFNNFGDRAYCRAHQSYTCAGYLPTEIVTVSPDATVKKVAGFRFISKSDMTAKAGWREKTVMDNAVAFDIESYKLTGGKYVMHGERITLITRDNGPTESATWDTMRKEWVG